MPTIQYLIKDSAKAKLKFKKLELEINDRCYMYNINTNINDVACLLDSYKISYDKNKLLSCVESHQKIGIVNFSSKESATDCFNLVSHYYCDNYSGFTRDDKDTLLYCSDVKLVPGTNIGDGSNNKYTPAIINKPFVAIVECNRWVTGGYKGKYLRAYILRKM